MAVEVRPSALDRHAMTSLPDRASAPRVGVACIVLRNDRILLMRRAGRHEAGTWSTPGGHLDFGETPAACAARETEEETGVRVSGLRFVAITNDIFEATGKHYLTIWMRAESSVGDPAIGAPTEVAEVGWYDLDDLPAPLFLSLENLLAGRGLPPDAATSGQAGIIRFASRPD